jgi:hypothetical protein
MKYQVTIPAMTLNMAIAMADRIKKRFQSKSFLRDGECGPRSMRLAMRVNHHRHKRLLLPPRLPRHLNRCFLHQQCNRHTIVDLHIGQEL